MKFPKNIKIKPTWLGKNTALAIYPNVYLPQGIYKKLLIDDPICYSFLLHEQEHIKRQKELGIIKWLLKYIFSQKFRFEEEMLADVQRIKYLNSKGVKFDINKRAKELSGWIYLWCVSSEEVMIRLRNLIPKFK